MTIESLPPEAPLPWSLRHEIGRAGGTPADGPEYHFYVTSAGGDVARIYPIDQAGEVVGERIVEAVNAYAEAARLTRERDAALEALKELRAAVEDAYKAGRVPALPFVSAGNTITSIETGAIHNDQ